MIDKFMTPENAGKCLQQAFRDALISEETQPEFPNNRGLLRQEHRMKGKQRLKLDHKWHAHSFAQLLTALPNLAMQPKACSNSLSSKAIVKRQ